MMSERFIDNGESAYSFMKNELLVTCPQCQQCAYGFIDPTKIICHKCGLSKTYETYSYGNGTFCGEDLWLKANCCSEKLWAYNKEHLEFIEQYVQAAIRERKPNVNQSLASRLPQWMKRSGNREKILRSVHELKQKLEVIL